MLAAVFPGQGSQKVGMGAELLDLVPFRSFLEEKAEKYRLEDFLDLAFKGPEEKINQTAVAQPLLYLFDLAYLELFREAFPGSDFKYYAGHSLGEYAALVAAGVLDFEDGLMAVKKRGELMAEEADKVEGGMLAVLKISQQEAEEISQQTGVEIANYNSPQQFVFSGLKADLCLVKEKAERKGGRAIFLSVSGPFHSKYMKPAGEKLYSYLEGLNLNLQNAQKVVFNFTALPFQGNGNLAEILARQVFSPVRWQQSIEFLAGKEVSTFIELGPGRVLSGLLKYIHPESAGLTFDSVSELESLKSILSGGKNV